MCVHRHKKTLMLLLHFVSLDVKNAFAMTTPTKYWVCATEMACEKFEWMSLLQQTIKAAIKE